MFQPTHPHGVRLDAQGAQVVAFLVSTHAPARGATDRSVCSRMVRGVSTHAPARGATQCNHGKTMFILVSTHAPARGATNKLAERFPERWCFNPRTRTGCDLHAFSDDLVLLSFNPRTRTGCDLTAYTSILSRIQFQPTHPHGVRRSHELMSSWARWFQPTHPHGVRPQCLVCIHARPRFNPRTRTGCDYRRPT